MACCNAWSKIPFILKFVVCFALGAFITTLLGFAVPLWNTYPDGVPFVLVGSGKLVRMKHVGLWQACASEYGCIAITHDISGFMIAARLFMTLALIGAFVESILLILFFCVESLQKEKKYKIAMLICAFATALCIFIAIMVWGNHNVVKHFLSFAFAMACIGLILYTFTGCSLAFFFWQS